jgi:protein-S-isoprenylcysteine O-methyltransferase Ste14
MPAPLRLAAFLAYLASWLAVAITALIHSRPRQAAAPQPPNPRTLAATILQAASALPITLHLPDGPLQPHAAEAAAALLLAPAGAALFLWAQRSAPRHAPPGTLVTTGAYARLRHPIYAAFLCLLAATGLLASARVGFAAALALYIAATEYRIAREEAELTVLHPAAYPEYQRRTRWRYAPGLR